MREISHRELVTLMDPHPRVEFYGLQYCWRTVGFPKKIPLRRPRRCSTASNALASTWTWSKRQTHTVMRIKRNGRTCMMLLCFQVLLTMAIQKLWDLPLRFEMRKSKSHRFGMNPEVTKSNYGDISNQNRFIFDRSSIVNLVFLLPLFTPKETSYIHRGCGLLFLRLLRILFRNWLELFPRRHQPWSEYPWRIRPYPSCHTTTLPSF